jgi:hypothetical protein
MQEIMTQWLYPAFLLAKSTTISVYSIPHIAPLQIQRQQLLQNLLIRQIGLPAIRGADGGIETFVREFEPGGTSVV